jgi:hypothetical protein
MPGLRPSAPAAWTTLPARDARIWGIAMKLLAVVIVATVLGVIVVNRDDIIRYMKMRQM